MPSLSRAPKLLNLSRDPIFIEIETTRMSGTPPYDWDEDNLSSYIQLWKKGDPDDIFIAEWNQSYSRYTKKTFANLKEMIPVSPQSPSGSSIGAIPFVGNVVSGVAESAFSEFYIKYADRYGSPAEIEATLQQSADYAIVYGSSKYWYGFGPDNELNDAYLLHSTAIMGTTAINNKFWKEVKKDQPEYAYILSRSGGNTTISVDLIYSDGTQDTYNVATHTLEKGVNWIAIAYSQIGIEGNRDQQKELNAYKVNFSGVTSGTLQYVLYDHEDDYNWYVLMDTGIGGCETVRFSGRKTYEEEVTREAFRSVQSLGSNFTDGEVDSYSEEGYPVIKANTGYYSKNYIQHLKQILYAKVWLIDTNRKKFIKYRVLSTRVVTGKDNDDLYSLEVSMAQAFYDKSKNTFNQ